MKGSGWKDVRSLGSEMCIPGNFIHPVESEIPAEPSLRIFSSPLSGHYVPLMRRMFRFDPVDVGNCTILPEPAADI